MKLSVAKEHRDFFRTHLCIEFNGLLSPEQCDQFMIESKDVISARVNLPKMTRKSMSLDQQFTAGFDLWRGNTPLKKIILQKNLAQAAADLLEIRSLRIGYDQLLSPPPAAVGSDLETLYGQWLSHPSSLEDRSSIQGITMGLMICVQAPEVPPAKETVLVEEAKSPQTLFPLTLGNAVYFSPQMPLDFSELALRKGYRYLLITYAKSISVYCKKEMDPHNQSFKQFGYDFGDRLSDRYHPVVLF